MFLGFWGRMRKRREEKKKEIERLEQERLDRHNQRIEDAFNHLEKVRQRRAAMASVPKPFVQHEGTLTARRAVENSRSDMASPAVSDFVQSVSSYGMDADYSCNSHSSSNSSSDSGGGDSGNCGGSD